MKKRTMLLATLLIAAAAGSGIALQQPSLPAVPTGAPTITELSARAKASLAQLSGTRALAGTHEPVEVFRDDRGIPHIYAKNTEDLFYAQGFVMAQDRLWQLEMWRRAGEGKLAQVLGPDFVQRDKMARLLEYRG